MSDKSNPGPVPGTSAGEGSVTRDQRQALVRAFQAEAMQREDPLLANLGVLSADLMGFAHRLASAVQAGLGQGAPSAEGHRRFLQNAEMYLKFIRQIDRLAQIERRLSPLSNEEDKER